MNLMTRETPSIPFGRRTPVISGKRVLMCRCDAATLIIPLPTPHKGSFCKLCDLSKYKQPTHESK